MWFILMSLFGLGGIAMTAGSSGSNDSESVSPTSVVTDVSDTSEDADDHVGGGHDGTDADDGNGDHGDDGGHDGTDGHGGDDGHDEGHGSTGLITPPETPEEIAAFVESVRNSPETHMHGDHASLADEHMMAMDLVDRAEATHIAIGHGDWNDPDNWHNGEVPGDGARALVPEGVQLFYSGINDAELFTLRVDGHLEFDQEVDAQLVVDTLVVSPTGELTIGTQDDPVPADVNIDIIFANNGPIDTDWDPTLLSRGMITHGKVEIHGAEKDSHEKVIEDPMAGDTWIDFTSMPEGWAVGDTIVIAGTHYDGYLGFEPVEGYVPPQDETRVITDISGGRVFFDDPLAFDHDSPRDDLKTSVANYTRNVSFETQDAELAEVYERGHIMFMHNDDVDVRYAEFHELGRTDKSEDALPASQFDEVSYDSNVTGRYAFHFHRTGTEDQDNPAIAEGNAVFGSPGWGFVHHDSNAILENNASYNTFGAGFVAESGNETGVWSDNIAIFAQGVSWKVPKLANNLETFDLGRSGDGFWFQGRMVDAVDNVAASVNNGFVYFHRGDHNDSANLVFDADVSPVAEALGHGEGLKPAIHPILGFSGNETIASKVGLSILKSNPAQGHDVHSTLEDFTAWNVAWGVDISYSGHYVFKNFDLIGRDASELVSKGEYGLLFDNNLMNVTFVDTHIENFEVGADLHKSFSNPDLSPETHSYTFVDLTLTDVDQDFIDYDPALDRIVNSEDLPEYTPDLVLDGPLTFKAGNPALDPGAGVIHISGTKTDGLGETDFVSENENYSISLKNWKTRNLLNEKGYYSTEDGENVVMLDIYFSDRLTGDIYTETHPVFLHENVLNDGAWRDMTYNGMIELGSENDPSSDVAELWAILTKDQPEPSDATASHDGDEEMALQESL